MNAREARNSILLALLATILFADVLFLGSGFFHRDLFRYHYPMKKVVRETIAHGEFPYWNRYWSGGQPMAANPAYEIFYPPQWLIFVGSFDFGFNLHILFHVYIALIGMYALLRALAAHQAAAIFGAISFALGGFFLGSMTTLPTFFVWAWAPLAGWAVVRLIQEPSAGRFVIAAAILAMQLLVGEPVALLQVWVLVALTRRFAPPSPASGRGLLLLLVLALALSAVQVIPAIDHARDSVRSRGFAFDVVTDYSMPLIRPLELFIPRLFGVLDPREQSVWGGGFFARRTPYFLSISCGVAAAILALGGLIARIRGSVAVISIAAVTYVLAIGKATPLYRWLYDAGVRSLRYPEKFIASFIFVMVVFAALVLDRFLDGDQRVRRSVRIAACIAVMIAALPLVFWHFGPEAAALVPVARRMWLAGLAVTVAWATLTFLRATRLWFLVALFFLLVDVVWVGREASPALPRNFFTPPAIVAAFDPHRHEYAVFHRGEWIHDADYQRARSLPPWFLARNALQPLTPAAWGIRSALNLDYDETDLLPTHELLDALMRRGPNRFIEASNVRYILDYAASSTVKVNRVRNRGRYFVDNGTVRSIHESANTASVEVETSVPATLFAVATRHKYWRAAIDGREVPIVPANIAFQAVQVPPGRHVVTWRYRNPLILWSGIFSALSWIAAAIMVITTRRRPLRPLQNES